MPVSALFISRRVITLKSSFRKVATNRAAYFARSTGGTQIAVGQRLARGFPTVQKGLGVKFGPGEPEFRLENQRLQPGSLHRSFRRTPRTRSTPLHATR